MKRVKTKSKNKKYYLSDKQAEKIKLDAYREATNKAILLCVAAMGEHLELTDEQICSTAKVIDRWAGYIDQKILRLNEVSEIIKNDTGIDFGRF